jgi:hypothetical protein
VGVWIVSGSVAVGRVPAVGPTRVTLVRSSVKAVDRDAGVATL